jgi:DNA repair exonuclease SbcCD ATPase subunit
MEAHINHLNQLQQLQDSIEEDYENTVTTSETIEKKKEKESDKIITNNSSTVVNNPAEASAPKSTQLLSPSSTATSADNDSDADASGAYLDTKEVEQLYLLNTNYENSLQRIEILTNDINQLESHNKSVQLQLHAATKSRLDSYSSLRSELAAANRSLLNEISDHNHIKQLYANQINEIHLVTAEKQELQNDVDLMKKELNTAEDLNNVQSNRVKQLELSLREKLEELQDSESSGQININALQKNKLKCLEMQNVILSRKLERTESLLKQDGEINQANYLTLQQQQNRLAGLEQQLAESLEVAAEIRSVETVVPIAMPPLFSSVSHHEILLQLHLARRLLIKQRLDFAKRYRVLGFKLFVLSTMLVFASLFALLALA